jgi:hypothetical protein
MFMLTTCLQSVRYSTVVIKIVIILGGKVTPVPDGLTSKLPDWYLNFSTCYMKKSVFSSRKLLNFAINSIFLENTAEIVEHVINFQYFLLLPNYA